VTDADWARHLGWLVTQLLARELESSRHTAWLRARITELESDLDEKVRERNPRIRPAPTMRGKGAIP